MLFTNVKSSRFMHHVVQSLGIFAIVMATVAPAFAKPQKIQVSDPSLSAQIAAKGGRLLADYGSYQLYETDQLPPDVVAKRGVEVRDEYDIIRLNAAHIDTTKPEAKSPRKPVGAFKGKRMHLVQFVGPVQPAWYDAMLATGVKVVDFVPSNTYIVYAESGSLSRLHSWAATSKYVQWDGAYQKVHKVHPRARAVDGKGNRRQLETDEFTVQLQDDPDANAATLQLIDQLKLEPIARQSQFRDFVNITARLAPESVDLIAAQPDVVSIHPYFTPKKSCERQAQITAGNLTGNAPTGPGYLAWLTSKGFTQALFDASNFAVDVTDSGIDNATTSPNHFGLYTNGIRPGVSRVIYNRLEGTPNAGSTIQGCDGHGNINAHIIAGYNDLTGFPHADGSGFRYGLGIAPFVRVGSSVIFDTATFTFPNYGNLQSRAYRDGARLSSNSWGADNAGGYNSDAQTYDALVRDAQPTGSAVPNSGNQEMVIIFANGNAGSGAQTVGSPATAKNVISVGAAENVQAFGGSDGCAISDTGANSANDIISFSSRGPCADGRKKPDIVAPGTHVSGGVAQAATPGSTGTKLACYDGTGVCGGVSSIYFPSSGQQFYTASSGTSHSTPGVAGGAALIRQYFINQGWPIPSPAMTKAFLMNTARYMNGTGANDTLWSNNQGMGMMNLGMGFDGVARIRRDQLTADKFTASGQTRTITGTVSDNTKPFRVTVAWTDAPGATSGNAYKNDLDLTVTVGGNTYKGNVFSGANSVTGGTADPRNNAESVFLPAGVSGPFSITITAANINSDGVPNETPTLDQDFALVIYNGTETLAPVIAADSSELTSESCSPGNSAVDPNETVTFNFLLKNIGSSNTVNLMATLQATGGVTAPSAPQNYGALIAGGAAVSRSFTFTANGSCGGTIVATLQLQDGATSLGTVTFNFSLGALSTAFSQNFDGVTAPALPAGWTTAAGGGQSTWVTTAAVRDSLPNSAFSPDPATVGSNELVSVAIPIVSSSAQLTFRNNYNMETGFDGGVLEIKIGSGMFTDILTAGGSFVSGGYTHTLSSSYSNPFGGRQAWSGNSSGFITTKVNLPAAAAGQNIQLRWRCGTDSSQSGTGWYIDTITIDDRACCTTGGNAPPTITSAQISPSPDAFSDEPLSVINIVASDPESDPISFAYQWQYTTDGTSFLDQGGATAASLPAAPGNSGKLWRCRITPSDAFGSGTPFITATVAVNNRPGQLGRHNQLYSYDSDLFMAPGTSFTRSAIINEFSQGTSGSKEWIEILFLKNSDARGWRWSDSNSNVTNVFSASATLWSSVPAGTLLVIYNGADRDTVLPADDTDPSDGTLVVAHNNAALFSGSWPALGNTGGDNIGLRDSASTLIDGVSYGTDAAYSPQLSIVGSASSASYTNNTEAGADVAGNWQIISASSATPAAGNGGLNTQFVTDIRNGVFGQPQFRLGASSELVSGLSINASSGLYSGSINVPGGGFFNIVIERFVGATVVSQQYSLLVGDSSGVYTVPGSKTWAMNNNYTIAGTLVVNGTLETAGRTLVVSNTLNVTSATINNAAGLIRYHNLIGGPLPGASEQFNTLPAIAATSINPASPNTLSNLTAEVTAASDADGDPISFSYQWQQSNNGSTFANIPYSTSVLSASATIAGKYYRVLITPFDGIGSGVAFPTASVFVPVDSDGNGLNDDWESQNFGAIGIDPNADPDGDGMTNAQEEAAGTNPNNSASSVRITAIQTDGNDVIVSFTTKLGKLYRLEWSNNPDGSSPTTVADNVPGTGGIVQRTDPGAATQPKRFYRLRLL